MRIKNFTTKSGSSITPTALTILVGPNNVGKSRTLRDLRDLIVSPTPPTTLISHISIEKPAAFDELLEGMHVIPSPMAGQQSISGIGSDLKGAHGAQLDLDRFRKIHDASTDGSYIRGIFGQYCVAYLNADSRLSVSEPTEATDVHQGSPGNLPNLLYREGKNPEDKLRAAFKRTFGTDIRLDYSGLRKLYFRIAREFPEISPDPREAQPVMRNLASLHEQGDGFRSFVGAVLPILLLPNRLVLLDEPEAFLHPAQARALGQWIAEQTRDRVGQIIVATHNANFLSGALSVGSHTTVIRLNRDQDKTTFLPIDKTTTDRFAKSPILSSQRVIEAIFHRGAVVCEADADRSFYQAATEKCFPDQNLLFVHAHNKQAIKDVITACRCSGVPTVAIADIDLLNSADELEKLIQAQDPNVDPASLIALQKKVFAAVSGTSEAEIIKAAQPALRDLIAEIDKGEHTLAGLRGALNRISKSLGSWSKIKEEGLAGFPDSVRPDAKDLIANLAAIGIYVVPVGELEQWIPLQVHKKRWVVEALQLVSDGNIPPALIEFLGAIRERFPREAAPKP